MKRLLLTLMACAALSVAKAQLSWSVTTSAGLTFIDENKHDNDEDGGLYGLGAELGYDFGGRVGLVKLGLGYERYRDFAINRDFSASTAKIDPDRMNDNIRYRHSIEGWKVIRLNLGVEGPFFILPDDAPLRMFVNGGMLLTTGIQQYGVQLILPDSTGQLPQDRVEYTSYGESLTEGPRPGTIDRINFFAGFGLAYRLNPTLSISASYEESFGPVGRKYGGVYVDRYGGYGEAWHNYYAGAIRSFRLGLSLRVF